MRGEIEFRGVRVCLSHGQSVVQDVSFKVKQGQTVAIVGQTGAGKTSLVKLINRTYDVTSGQVLVDGVDVREWNLASLRSQISIIEQDIFLFSRSLSDNIAFGKPGATKEEIIAASIAAQAHDFILGFDQGYDTVVGERGVTLSGGQRQRIALARAFLTDPRILVLDDSTSAIELSHRGQNSTRHLQRRPRTHDLHHHAPPVADPLGGFDHRLPQRQDRRHRHAR